MTQISQQFIQHISKQLADEKQLQQLIDFCHKPLRKSIRVNTLKQSSEHFFQQWQNAGYQLKPIPWCEDGFWIDESVKPLPSGLGNFLPHLSGEFYIQEASSMLPVSALLYTCPNPKLVLDVAAAPGSKTTQIAADLENQGLIVANELSSSRIKGLFSNVQRCGISNVCLSHADGKIFGDKTTNTFDAILLDAPCGGEGTVRKDPEALKDWSLESVIKMSELQKELIVSAFKALKNDGVLVYSTCTLSYEENQQVCEYLLKQFPDNIQTIALNELFEGAEKAVTSEGYLQLYPQIFDSEGFFVACFKKTTVQQAISNIDDSRFPFQPIDHKTCQHFQQYARGFGWQLEALEQQLWQRKNEIWYFPDGIENLIGKIKMDRIGVKIAEQHKKGFALQHQAVISFFNTFELSQTSKLELSSEQAIDYYQGKDLFLTSQHLGKGEVIVTYNGNPLGLCKNLGNKLKNKLPRELVRDNPFANLS